MLVYCGSTRPRGRLLPMLLSQMWPGCFLKKSTLKQVTKHFSGFKVIKFSYKFNGRFNKRSACSTYIFIRYLSCYLDCLMTDVTVQLFKPEKSYGIGQCPIYAQHFRYYKSFTPFLTDIYYFAAFHWKEFESRVLERGECYLFIYVHFPHFCIFFTVSIFPPPLHMNKN